MLVNNNLVSIIIPNYNRANLIGETLESILKQTYTNWECIIVDDGSTDDSITIIEEYLERDNRFILFTRPTNFPKGANACRNIGMRKSIGDYIIFFDSDDLMMENHVESKLNFMLNGDLDYAVFKSKNFNQPDDVSEYLDYSYYQKYDFTADNYLENKLRFYTNDLIIKNVLAKQCEFFYKYRADIENVIMTQLVLLSNKNGFKNEEVTLKRYHINNLTTGVENDEKIGLNHSFYYYYNILDYLYNLKASTRAVDFNLNHLLYFYRKIDFSLQVNFFEFLFKILKFKNSKIILGVLYHRIKKIL